MKTSTPCTDLLASLLAARLAFPAITRNCQGFSKRTGKKYGYADLSAIVEATAPILGQHGLLLVQAIEDGDGGTLRVASTLFHVASGQWLSSELSVTKPDELQEYGAASTYCKRYAQVAMLNLSTSDEDDDAASLNGSSKAEKSAAADKFRASEPVNGNGHTPAPEPGSGESLERPTEGHIAALSNLALTECGEDKDVYYQRIRQIMGLKPAASVAPRLLTRTMSMAQYMELFAYYRRLESQLDKGKEASSGPEPVPTESAESPAAPATAAESLAVDPPPAAPGRPSVEAGSSSAASSPEPDPEYHKLYQEALGWGVNEAEIKHVLDHHRDLAKCRTILWKARRNEPLPVWERVPAA